MQRLASMHTLLSCELSTVKLKFMEKAQFIQGLLAVVCEGHCN